MTRRLQEGTVISEETCPGCGAAVAVRENSAGGVFFYCSASTGKNEKTGKAERCMTRLNIGRAGSKKIIDEFLTSKKETPDVQPQPEQKPEIQPESAPAGNDDGIPERKPDEPKSGTIGDAILSFLTG